MTEQGIHSPLTHLRIQHWLLGDTRKSPSSGLLFSRPGRTPDNIVIAKREARSAAELLPYALE